jgi:hypothetical protein
VELILERLGDSSVESGIGAWDTAVIPARNRNNGHDGNVSGRVGSTILEQGSQVGKLLSEVEPERVE